MKTFFCYFYYCLYKWLKKGNGSTASLLTVTWITVTLFLYAAGFLSLITICTGIDAGGVLSIPKSKYAGVAWLSVWGLFVWLGLKFFHVHEKAFSDEMKQKYEKMGCKGWWVITCLVASYVFMGVTTWFAGTRLGMH